MKSQDYLDCNATTPIADEVAAAMTRTLADAFGNPSSIHWAGLLARDAVKEARSQVVSLLCCDATEIVFGVPHLPPSRPCLVNHSPRDSR